jgi:hypothetical protein
MASPKRLTIVSNRVLAIDAIVMASVEYGSLRWEHTVGEIGLARELPLNR